MQPIGQPGQDGLCKSSSSLGALLCSQILKLPQDANPDIAELLRYRFTRLQLRDGWRHSSWACRSTDAWSSFAAHPRHSYLQSDVLIL